MRCHINYLLEEQIPMVNSKQCVFLKQKARLKPKDSGVPNQLKNLKSVEIEMRMGLKPSNDA